MHSETSTPTTVVTTSETVAISGAAPFITPPIPGPPLPPIPCLISGVINFTEGTTGTAVTIRCRGGINTITGPVIENALVVTLAAAASDSIPFEFYDAVGRTDGYTITVTQTGATANGTVNEASLDITQGAAR